MKPLSIILALYAAVAGEPAARQAPSADGWKLTWADEFENSGRPDPRNWTYETALSETMNFSGTSRRTPGAKTDS